MADSIKIGSLRYDGKVVSPTAKYRGEQIGIGDTTPGMEILFVNWNGIYVASKTICPSSSWVDLHEQGLIFGREVTIDGKEYLCRSLKVGAKSGMPNEWDDLLDAFDESNKLLHWKSFFWGQEVDPGDDSLCMIRGGFSARSRSAFNKWDRGISVGFRPVLEPLFSNLIISGELIGYRLGIYSGDNYLSGVLVGYDDYDLELKAEGSPPRKCSWIKRIKDSVFIDRDAIRRVSKINT